MTVSRIYHLYIISGQGPPAPYVSFKRELVQLNRTLAPLHQPAYSGLHDEKEIGRWDAAIKSSRSGIATVVRLVEREMVISQVLTVEEAQKIKRGAEGYRFRAIYGLWTMDFRMNCLKNCLDVSMWDKEKTYQSIQWSSEGDKNWMQTWLLISGGTGAIVNNGRRPKP